MSTHLSHRVIRYSAVETGKEIRKALKAAFPGVKFSLRMSRGTGYGWFHLDWTDGPPASEVDPVANQFRSSYFESMDDSTRRIEPTMTMDEGGNVVEHDYTCHGVNPQRRLSEEAKAQLDAYIDSHGGDDAFNYTHIPGRDVTRGIVAATWTFN